MSRNDILTGKTIAHWMPGQNVGEPPYAPPNQWPAANKLLNVPKCVILSSLPNWSLMWKKDFFYGPRDVIGQMFTSPFSFGNYYYFEQWDAIDDSAQQMTGVFDPNDPRFTNGSMWDLASSISGNKLAYSFDASNPDLPPTGQFTDTGTRNYKGSRFHQVIGTIDNNVPLLHLKAQQAFVTAANVLAKDNIYVLAPNWMPPQLAQTRNGFLTETNETYNSAHGTQCNIADANQCYIHSPAAWGPAYPNVNDPRNVANITHPPVPWLLGIDPAVGVNCLHLYVGMPMHNYDASNVFWGEQAYPLMPEGNYIGPILNGNYLGAPLPFFTGRRAVWRDFGFDYGYKQGIPAVYNNYKPIVEGAAGTYKQNFYNFRNMDTYLTTYPGNLFDINWTLKNIWKDQKHDCHSTQFYFGFTFDEFINLPGNATEDHWFLDCNPQYHLKFSDGVLNFPDSPSLRAALAVFYPPIVARVENYYNNIRQGTLDYFQHTIDANDLGSHGVKVGGPENMTDADSIIDFVREYFKDR